jgi:hypothetical protein
MVAGRVRLPPVLIGEYMKKLIGFGLILVAITGALMTSCIDGTTSVEEEETGEEEPSYYVLEVGHGIRERFLDAGSGQGGYVILDRTTAAKIVELKSDEYLKGSDILDKYYLALGNPEEAVAGIIEALSEGYVVLAVVTSGEPDSIVVWAEGTEPGSKVETVYNVATVEQGDETPVSDLVEYRIIYDTDLGYYLLNEETVEVNQFEERAEKMTLQEAVKLIGLTKAPAGLEYDLWTGRAVVLQYSDRDELDPTSGLLVIWE